MQVRYLLVSFIYFVIHINYLYALTTLTTTASTSGTLLGPINGSIGSSGSGFGGVSCQGDIDSDQQVVPHGTVILERTSNDELVVTVTLKNGDERATYFIEIFESAPSCGSDDLADTGVILSSDNDGNGQSVATLQLPLSFPGHTTIGDELGTESIVVVLDIEQSSSFKVFDGNRFATKPILIPSEKSAPRISVSTSEGKQLTTIFSVTGNGFTPSGSVIQRLQQPDGNMISITPNISADKAGNIIWNFTPKCDVKIGLSKLWLIDNKSGIISNSVELNIVSNEDCSGVFKADFYASAIIGQVPLKVKFTDKSLIDPKKGNPTTWTWNFGDGNTSSKQNPEHTFNTSGTCTVSMMASNVMVSDWEIKTGLINVAPSATPTAQFKASHFIGIAPMKVKFTDISEDNPESWTWDFGDGKVSNLQNPDHTYNESGFYTVTFTANNLIGADTVEKINLINVMSDGEPIAMFTCEPYTGFSPLTCNFTNLSSGNIGDWEWDFGDGETSELENPSHTYKEPGIFTVNLTVKGPNGTSNETNTIDVMDGLNSSVNIIAELVGNPRNGQPRSEVKFKDISSGKISGWLWNFGDTGTSTAQNPKHVYTENGIYPVTLTVFNNDGKAVTKTKPAYIEIAEQAIPDTTEIATPTPVPTLTPIVETSPTAAESHTPLPTISPAPEPTPKDKEPDKTTENDPSNQNIIHLIVKPQIAQRILRFQTALVSVLNQNETPIPDVEVKAFTNVHSVMVEPSSAITDKNGNAEFKYRFRQLTYDAEIIFKADDFTATITLQ